MSDDPIRPDDVTAGGDQADGSGGTLDRLAERAVDTVLHVIRRANALAGGVLIFATICSIGGFLLGYAALSDGMQTVWIIIGGFFAFVAISSVIRAMLRLGSIRRTSDDLVAEVRTLIGGDQQVQSRFRETIDTAEEMRDDGIVDLSREFVTIQTTIGGRAEQFRALSNALSAITAFPGFVLVAMLISIVFIGLSLIFTIALLL